MPRKSLVVVRTHFYDQRLRDFVEPILVSPDHDVVIAVDENWGAIDMHGIPKLSMTSDLFRGFGLYVDCGNIMWLCGDYSLYLARREFPDAANYWLIEYDAVINRPEPIAFFRELDGVHAHDFLSTHFREREPGWDWGDPMMAEYAVVWRSYFPLVRLSGRAIDFLLERRMLASSKIMAMNADARPNWPNDESFVACELHYHGFDCADFSTLGDYYDGSTFSNSVLLHPDHLPPHDGRIYHMVREGSRYLKMVRPHMNNFQRPTPGDLIDLARNGLAIEEIKPVLAGRIAFELGSSADVPEKILQPGGLVMALLEATVPPPPLQLGAVIQALAKLRMRCTLDALALLAVERGWPATEAFSNVALARPAWQSSIGFWSRQKNYRLDAEGGNDGDHTVDWGFHTASEPNGHWTVDLQQTYLLTEVRIYNRVECAYRMNGFQLLASLDGTKWHVAYESPPGYDLGSSAHEPIRIALFTPAKLLRVRSGQDGFFHFRELEAYGTPARSL